MEQALILDRYRPLAGLARGGFGEVVLAYDTRMQRRVAIKRLPIARADHRATPAGLAEARTAALLNHPNIVTVHEWDTDSDEAFIIMEYVEGASLAEVLDAEGALDFDEVAAVVEAVSSAVQFAHDNGVLHLDIKPENVLVTHEGRVKVTDFGISALSTATGHGPAAGGTIGYMPPEQLRNDRVDERTDVWALAALTFEMLTNANPFAADSIEGALFKQEIIEPPSLDEYAGDLPAEIDTVLAAALAPHGVDRYRSVAAFAAALLPHLGDPAVGRETLAALVESEFAEEDADAAVDWQRVGAWDRLGPAGGALARALAAFVAGWGAYAGLAAFAPGTPALAGGAALAALAGALAPGLGAVLGLALLLAGVARAGWWPLALGLGLVAAPVWWFSGRRGSGFAGALASPLLSAVRVGLAPPLLLGFWLPPLRAAVLSAFAACVTMLASAASGAHVPFAVVSPGFFADPLASRVVASGVKGLLGDPSALLVVAGWALAGAVMSLACARASRAAAIVGAFLGGAALYGAYLLAQMLATALGSDATWAGQALLPHLTASLILVVLVAAAGAPPRAEEE